MRKRFSVYILSIFVIIIAPAFREGIFYPNGSISYSASGKLSSRENHSSSPVLVNGLLNKSPNGLLNGLPGRALAEHTRQEPRVQSGRRGSYKSGSKNPIDVLSTGVPYMSLPLMRIFPQGKKSSSILMVNGLYAANNVEPSKGTFLIASPNLIDPNFSKTVVLLIKYSRNGAMGLVINRPSDIRLKEIIPKIRGQTLRNKKIFIGGPVAIYQLFLMVMSEEEPEGSYMVFDKVYLLQEIDSARRKLSKKVIKNQLRIYAGYAGWAPGQLDYEILRGDWYLIKADVNSIFFKAPDEVWPELIKKSSAQWV